MKNNALSEARSAELASLLSWGQQLCREGGRSGCWAGEAPASVTTAARERALATQRGLVDGPTEEGDDQDHSA